MTDYFAVLGLERRPLVSDPILRGAYYEKSRSLHPDHSKGGNFSVVNAAFEIVSNPAKRIRHLLELEFGELGFRQIEAELEGLFGTMVKVLQRADEELTSVSG